MKTQFLLLPLTDGAKTLVNISAISCIHPAVKTEGTTVTLTGYEICTTIPFNHLCIILRNHTISGLPTE